ncbi:hypothetical protein ACH5RR_002020 [Cinchona calisaya]|uniref:KIB1-4 beta-propeller domain-containing protein n=1 Tax=Cinchona calisaya TaxID=153742 RepID=A0ABD3B6F1_9GENT
MDKVELPSPALEDVPFDYYVACFLSSPSPTDPNCRAFFLHGPRLLCISCEVGAKEFRKQELYFGDELFIDAINFQGKIYCLKLPSCSLHCADFADDYNDEHLPEFREFINGGLLEDLVPQLDLTHYYLIESCGELLFVHKFCLGTEVVDFNIFRADFCEKRWERIKSIGDDRAIFIDDWKGFSASTIGSGVEGNCIYFINHGAIHVYDLEDQSILMPSPFPFNTQESDLRWFKISPSSVI